MDSLRLRRLRLPSLLRLAWLALFREAEEACVVCDRADADSSDAAAWLPPDEAVWLLTAVEASPPVWLMMLPRLLPRLLLARLRLRRLLARLLLVPAEDSDSVSDAVCDAL